MDAIMGYDNYKLIQTLRDKIYIYFTVNDER